MEDHDWLLSSSQHLCIETIVCISYSRLCNLEVRENLFLCPLVLENCKCHMQNLCFVVWIIFFCEMKLFSFLEIKFQNGAHLKKGYFWSTFHILVTRETTQKFIQHISQLHTRVLLTHWLFLPSQFCKNYEFIMYGFSLVWLLVLILSKFRAILEQSINNKMVCKL